MARRRVLPLAVEKGLPQGVPVTVPETGGLLERSRRTLCPGSLRWVCALVSALGSAACTSSSHEARPSGDGGSAADASIDESVLGATCGSDGDCGQGFRCALPPDDRLYGGSPARGYCTRSCEGLEDTSCVAFGGLCENVAGDGDPPSWQCLQACIPGGATHDVEKCHGRSDSACQPVQVRLDLGLEPVGLCYPVCSSDSHCGDTRVCDPRSGVCIEGALSGGDLGAACMPDASTCAGECIGYSEGQGDFAYGYCSQPCTYGIDGACPAEGWTCAFGDSRTTGVGDFARCQPTCESDGDCKGRLPSDPGVYCDMSTAASLGYGLCAWRSSEPADDGGSDSGAGDSGAGPASFDAGRTVDSGRDAR